MIALFFPAQLLANGINDATIERSVWQEDEAKFQDLENSLTRRIQIKPDSAIDHYLLAHLYIRKYSENPAEMNLLKKASDLAQQSIELEPSKEYGYVALAEVLDVMGQTVNALQLLKHPSSPFKKGWRTTFTIARLQLDSVSSSATLKSFKRALEHKGALVEVIAPYALAIMKSEYRTSGLLKELKKWDEDHPSETFKLAMGNTLTENRKYKEAHSIYVAMYTPNFIHQEAMLNDAMILAEHLGKRQKAKALLYRIIRIAESDKHHPNFKLSSASRQLGEIYLLERKLGSARNHFIKAILASPNRFESLETITDSYRKHKYFNGLVSTIKELNDKIPGSGLLHALLGETLSEDLNDHQSALDAFANAIILEPNRSDFYNGMGLAYYRSNNFDKALNMFNFASRIDPEDAIARYNSACVMARQNKTSEAIITLREAISLDPRLIENAREDKDFQSIKNSKAFVDILNQGPTDESFTGNDFSPESLQDLDHQSQPLPEKLSH